MHVLSVPCVVMASINFYVAAYYLFLYFKRPQTREHLPFALLCLSVGLYDIFCVGLYNSLSVDEGVFWQRLQLDVVSFISIFLIWFAFFFTGQKNNRIVKILIGWFAIILAVSLFINPDFSLSAAKPAVKYINLMNILKITYYEGEVGAIYLIGLLSGVLVYIYFIYLFIQYYKKTKRRVLIPFIISQFAYFFALINDTLVSMRVYPFIYVGEYAFFLIVIAVAYMLLNQFADLQTDFEELNNGLEQKVQERTREKEKLQTELFQSAKMAAIGQLAGGVAHEINNPLGVILGFAQTIARGIKEEDELYMPLKSIEREAIRCKKIVGDLLTFSRTGKTQMETIYINGPIEEILSLIEARAKVKNIEIIRKYGIDLPQITVNKNQIQQVIMNLCNNAIDAMAEAGKLTITTKQTGTQIEIDVADTGKGMTEEVKKHIFEPFYTTKEVEKGTGLGLSLCYEIIQKHNGTIEAESEEGKGAVFTIKLKVYQ